jgi:hypothetical protein
MEYLQSRECQSILSGKYQVCIKVNPVLIKHPWDLHYCFELSDEIYKIF